MKNMHFKIFKMIATRGFLTAVECTKSVFGRGSAPDPAGGAHDAPPDPLVGWGGGHPLPIPPSTPSASRSRRLRRLVLGAFGASFPKPPPKFFSGYGPVLYVMHGISLTSNSLTCVANDLQSLVLTKSQNRLKIDLHENHRSPSAY